MDREVRERERRLVPYDAISVNSSLGKLWSGDMKIEAKVEGGGFLSGSKLEEVKLAANASRCELFVFRLR